MDYKLALMTGVDIPIPECSLILHQPSIEEISMLGEEVFFTGIQCLWINKNSILEDNIDLSNMSNFQIFMTIIQDKESGDKKASVMDVLRLLFPKYNITFTPRSIFFKLEGDNIIIDENNFMFLQEILRDVFCYKESSKDSFNPVNDAAKEIAKKLMRGRQRVAAQKGDAGGSILGRYISVLTVGLGAMSLQDLVNCTMYQIYDLIERFGLYTNYDLDIRSRLAGGKPDQSPDDWMKNIH